MNLLICRPEGGLNDMLCQVQKCLEYCVKFNRALVLDSRSTGIFADEWDYFFRIRSSVPPIFSDKNKIQEIISNLKLKDVRTRDIYDALKNPLVDFSNEINFHLGGYQLTFDFSIEHPEKILLHHQCGGGNASHGILQKLCLQPHLAALLDNRLSKLPFVYDAIHCRNTDLKSDLKNFKIPKPARGIFLSTDSSSAKSFFSDKIQGSQVYFSESYVNGNKPLHSANLPKEQKRAVNENAILDLMTLGISTNLYVTNPTSGYSSLAMFLNKNPLVMLKMLSGAGSSLKTKARFLFSILVKPSKILKCVQ